MPSCISYRPTMFLVRARACEEICYTLFVLPKHLFFFSKDMICPPLFVIVQVTSLLYPAMTATHLQYLRDPPPYNKKQYSFDKPQKIRRIQSTPQFPSIQDWSFCPIIERCLLPGQCSLEIPTITVRRHPFGLGVFIQIDFRLTLYLCPSS